MADDINLPNLVSHLRVNLGDTNRVVADAARQGSSVGEALGQAMQRTLRAAVDDIPDVDIDADTSQADRDLHRVRAELDELANTRIGVDISVEEALRRMAELEPHLERLQNTHPSINVRAFVGGARADLEELREAARQADDTDIDIDVDVDTHNLHTRLDAVRRTLGRVRTAAAGLGTVAAMAVKASVAVGALAPLLASVVTTLANIAPAAALAVSGVLALQLATNTFKLAMSGVGDAVKAALDPSDPKAYAEALKKLSPNARSFVQEIRKAQPVLDAIKRSVQDKVFAGLDTQLATTGKTTLPIFRRALDSTAETLNRMGKGVLTAVRDLGKGGALERALTGATTGLRAFSRVPGQVVTALGQIGAAAGPTFARLSKAGGSALDKLFARLTQAFESGGMELAINNAIGLIDQLGRVFGNVFGGIGNIIKAVSSGGDGLFGTMERVSQAFEDVTATKDVQDGLRALAETSAVVSRTVLPLLAQALQIVGRVLVTLSKPLQSIVKVIGGALGRVMTALEPVLVALAAAFGSLLVALGPVIDLIADVVVATLPAFTVLFEQLGGVIEALAPVIAALATDLSSLLVPILSSLGTVLQILLPPFVKLAQDIFPLIADALLQLSPSFQELGVAIANLLISLAPIIPIFVQFIDGPLKTLIEEGLPQVILAIEAFLYALTTVINFITSVVVPQFMFLEKALSGDFAGAWEEAGLSVDGFKSIVRRVLTDVNDFTRGALEKFAVTVITKGNEAADGFVKSIQDMAVDALTFVATLPQRIVGALGSLGGLLFSAGASVISGFISGIESKIGSVRSTLGNLTSMIPDWKGPKRKDATLLTPAGKSIIKGLVDGIDASTSSLKSKLTSITNLIERAIKINAGNRHKVSGLSSLLKRVESDNKKLLSLAKQRDSVAAKLKAAQTKLNDAVKQRADAAAQIKQGILGDANITTGNSVVNSVAAITIGLQQAVAKAKKFAENLAKLKKAGLRTDLLDDIASAGLDGGAATAEALAKATPTELKKINFLQTELAKSAGKSGTSVAGAMYDAGVKAAQGLVDGLKKQQKNIETQMEKIGAAMVKAIKKALKIKSPSRVFMDIGTLTGDGLREGMLRSRTAVAAASRSMAAAAVGAADVASRAMQGVPAPGQLSAAYAGAGMAAGPTTNNFYLQDSDATPDGIVRALSWRGLVGRKGR